MVDVKQIDAAQVAQLLAYEEGHFLDIKGKDIRPAKLSRHVSAFANASGGELFVGIEEEAAADGTKRRVWRGFADQEEANDHFAVFEKLNPLGNHYAAEYLAAGGQAGLVLHVVVQKMDTVIEATGGGVYVRRNASSLPVNSPEALERLKFDKGIHSYEDERLNTDPTEITNSATVINFLLEQVPTAEPDEWLVKQHMIEGKRPTVAGVLLYSDAPQATLPKRSAVKITRYKTDQGPDRDFMVGSPETVEGPLYDLIYDAVARVKKIIEGVERVGPKGLEPVEYPEEALHELLTNAVLHRDYSIPTDVNVRIFDNRVEIESPGRLPGAVTVANIAQAQYARNPKIVRLINKFPFPPNKDVGEGVNTAIEAMDRLRLKEPLFEETEQGAVLVTLRHERLASPEALVMSYLETHPEITNEEARQLTGIKSENTMKNVFYRLRDTGQLELMEKAAGKKRSWRKPPPVDAKPKPAEPEQLDLPHLED
jgi:ATP-dependent DNA helicase RecG